MTQRHLVLAIGVLIAGVGLGLLFSFLFFPPNQGNGVPSPHEDLAILSSTSAADSQGSDATESNLVDILGLDKATERRIALYRLIENKTIEQIAELIRFSFTLNTSKHLSSIQGLLYTALARLDPHVSVDLVWESDRAEWDKYFKKVFEEYASDDPRRTMQLGSELNEPWRTKAFRTTLQTVREVSDKSSVELAKSFGVSDILGELTLLAELEYVIDEPRTAFEMVVEASIPEHKKSELVTLIADRWVEREGTEDAVSMFGLVYEVFSHHWHQGSLVASVIAAKEPAHCWEQLLTMSKAEQKLLNDGIFEAWLAVDAESALHALSQDEYMYADRWEVLHLYVDWASREWGQLPEKIELIPVEQQARVLDQAAQRVASRKEPSEVLALLADLRSQGVNTQEISDSFVSAWGRVDPVAAVEWVMENLDKERYPTYTFLEELALVDVQRALEYASFLPDDTFPEQRVVGYLFNHGRLETGLAVLSSVRDRTDLTYLYARAGELMIDSGQTSAAISLVEKLPAERESAYFTRLASRWRSKGLHEFIPVLSRLPSEKIRSRVSKHMLSINEAEGTLTAEEIEIVRSFVQPHAYSD
ncbi:MAG: hypothetical protein F4Z01_02435 [Gammaproteobacteria bacterium]|nr:hypothetical protein [Gammaproteobacteria bacterium]